jgi:hypothetical protein
MPTYAYMHVDSFYTSRSEATTCVLGRELGTHRVLLFRNRIFFQQTVTSSPQHFKEMLLCLCISTLP